MDDCSAIQNDNIKTGDSDVLQIHQFEARVLGIQINLVDKL